jgi:hypothetical protein
LVPKVSKLAFCILLDEILIRAIFIIGKFVCLHVQIEQPLNARLERCNTAALAKWLGISEGGNEAVRAVGLFCGGDYDILGAKNVVRATILCGSWRTRQLNLTFLCQSKKTDAWPEMLLGPGWYN